VTLLALSLAIAGTVGLLTWALVDLGGRLLATYRSPFTRDA
jgi:hypothetical protein